MRGDRLVRHLVCNGPEMAPEGKGEKGGLRLFLPGPDSVGERTEQEGDWSLVKARAERSSDVGTADGKGWDCDGRGRGHGGEKVVGGPV